MAETDVSSPGTAMENARFSIDMEAVLMNALIEQQNRGLAVWERMADLIKASLSANTFKAYRHALEKLSAWLADCGNGFCLDTVGNGGVGWDTD